VGHIVEHANGRKRQSAKGVNIIREKCSGARVQWLYVVLTRLFCIVVSVQTSLAKYCKRHSITLNTEIMVKGWPI